MSSFSRPLRRLVLTATLPWLLAGVCWAQLDGRRSHASHSYMLFVAGGRLTLLPRIPQNRSHSAKGTAGNRKFEWTFRRFNGTTTVTWTATSDGLEESLSFESDGNTSVTATQKPVEDSKEPALAFKQEPGKPLELTITEGDTSKTWTAEGLWLLLLQCPETCEKRLFPLLEAKELDLNLKIGYAALRDALLAVRIERAAVDRWKDLVALLDDDSFAEREAADRALRAGGPETLRFLRGLDLAKLKPEQQYRVARLLRHGRNALTADELPKVVERLKGNPQTWLALLADGDESVRRRAAENLAILSGREIEFDAAADEATRAGQVKAIRGRFE